MEGSCALVSTSVTITTRRAGDIAVSFNPPSTTIQPDALDLAASVTKFKHLPGAPKKAEAQLQPNLPDFNSDVSALDIVSVIDNVKGFAYPFSGPCVCPSAVPCDVTACSTGSNCTGLYGASATCVKSCTSGPNLDQPCNSDLHCGQCAGGANVGYPCDANGDCPGSTCDLGVCGSGFCRDRCGRCD
jgi:hypothetical protein